MQTPCASDVWSRDSAANIDEQKGGRKWGTDLRFHSPLVYASPSLLCTPFDSLSPFIAISPDSDIRFLSLSMSPLCLSATYKQSFGVWTVKIARNFDVGGSRSRRFVWRVLGRRCGVSWTSGRNNGRSSDIENSASGCDGCCTPTLQPERALKRWRP